MRKQKKKSIEPKKRGGRVPEVVKLQAQQFIMQVIGGEDGIDRIVHKVYMQALKGSYKHQELLLNYLLGKPVERLKLEAHGSAILPSRTVVKVIADTVRLNKLHDDAKAAPAVVDQDRIDEMERLLNKEVNGTDR